MPKTKLTEAHHYEIIRLYKEGGSSPKIAARFGVCPLTIRTVLHQAGVRIRFNHPNCKLTMEQRDHIAAAYAAGKSMPDLATEYGIHVTSVWSMLRTREVISRDASLAHRRLSLNEAVFDTITPESAYWIGFLMADGCVHQTARANVVALSLAEKDKDHVDRFRQFLGSDSMVRTITMNETRAAWKRSPVARFQVHSKALVASLARYGVVPRKSHHARVIGLENDRDFWRGVLDGDGFVFWGKREHGPYPHTGIVGSRELLEQFAAFARSKVLGCRASVRPMHSIWTVRAAGCYAARLLQVLYHDSQVSLLRKSKVVNEILAAYQLPLWS